MKKYINEDIVQKAIKANIRNVTDEQLQRLTSRILLEAYPVVSMLVRENIINERRNMLEGCTPT